MSPKLIPALDSLPSDSVLNELANWIKAGELVALPTETVYGIAARYDQKESIEKMKQLKGRGENHPFTVHLPDQEWAYDLIPKVSVFAERLMNRYWPGPMTLVLPDPKGNTIGLRVPAKELTREILRRVGAPVAMSSANPTGKKPATTAQEVAAMFPEGMKAIVDGGPCALGEASTVLLLNDSEIKILREGIITMQDIQRVIGRRVLFVCTGNTCRSPMAEALLKQALSEKYKIPEQKLAEFGYKIRSAGIVASHGSPASPQTIAALREIGVDGSKHRSHPLGPDTVLESDFVFAMSHGHLTLVNEISPETQDRHHLLHPEGKDIADPFGSSLEDYRKCRDQIRQFVNEISKSL